MARDLPHSADDLRAIADNLDRLAEFLTDARGNVTEGLELVQRIELADPWEGQKPPGWAVIHPDGWIGFEFNKEEK